MTTLTDTRVLTGRYLAHLRHKPGQLAATVAFPVMILLIFAYLLGGMMREPGDYRVALVPGMFTMTMLFGMSATMVAVVTDAQRGITDRFRSLPMSSAAVLLGRATADLLISAIGLAVLIAVGLLVGWRSERGLGAAAAAVGLLLLLRFALIWVGILFGTLSRDTGAVTAVQTLEFPLGFLSGLFVDPATMPPVVREIAEWNPLSATAAAVRELCGNPGWTGGSWVSDHALLMAVVWPLAIVAVAAPLAVRRYRRQGGTA
ncbi:ABC transporter permease [Pseudonocardia sp. CA-107938]|uniref:ABC transporter permease n=1 Tax=Pseudonocardia sp. CA-107938 TaxID=3240021 RepID=UPI003D8B3498